MNTIRSTGSAGSSRQPATLVKKSVLVLSVMAVVAGILTGLMTWANVGFSDAFVATWLKSFVTAMVVMMPVAGLLMVVFSKLVERFLPTLSTLRKSVLVGLSMSVVMQSIMAVITGYNAVGMGDMSVFRAAWGHAFITAFPVGLALALTLTTVVKPRLEAALKT